ncbi:MAG TPA: hypothetical protein VN428_13590 [Bryobacteraceae bacterium]|nr:hypothetical protein [Bryobacteraceae bacterium]
MSKLVHPDWRAAARAFAPDIPQEQVERIAPVLDALEARLRPLLTDLPLDLAPATDLEPGE